MSEPNFLQLKPPEPAPEDESEFNPDFDKLIESGGPNPPVIDPEKQLQKILDCVLPPR